MTYSLNVNEVLFRSHLGHGISWAFPNVAVMARQYLGCPATSATVERLFSKVGVAFSAKRKSSDAGTLEAIAFAEQNL